MNNLTLYLLLATDEAAESKTTESLAKPEPAKPIAMGGVSANPHGIYQPLRRDSRTLNQASYRPSRGMQPRTPATEKLAFSASVVVNALGFLTLISGFWLLLQIAQASLA